MIIFVSIFLDTNMKVVSFFSAKGGTGKTSFNMMFASFLRYGLGKNVLVLDFDRPEYNLSYTRKREIAFMDKEGNGYGMERLYPIEEVAALDEKSISRIAGMLKSLSDEFDYIVMDFPGSFCESDAVCILAMKQVLDFIVIPVELDAMNIASSKALAQIFHESGLKTILFFNRVHGKEKTELYDELRTWFCENGIIVLENIVKSSISMKREMGCAGYFRSSVAFPERLVMEKNPGVVNLFREVVGYVEGEMEQSQEMAV